MDFTGAGVALVVGADEMVLDVVLVGLAGTEVQLGPAVGAVKKPGKDTNSMSASNSGSLSVTSPYERRGRFVPAMFSARLLQPLSLPKAPRSCQLRPRCASGGRSPVRGLCIHNQKSIRRTSAERFCKDIKR